MTDTSSGGMPRLDADLMAMAVVLGFGGGLMEGVAHMALQRLGVLDNVWYPIIWIAAVLNGLLVTLLGMLLSVGLRVMIYPRTRPLAVFVVVLAGILPVLGWVLREWIHQSAIAILTLAIASAATRWMGRHDETTRRFFRRAVRWTIAATLLVFVAIEGGARARERMVTARLPAAEAMAPNVLLIVIDALRADHLSCYGYSRPSSPAIDRLAAEGVVFEQAFATSSYTLPSHASILTGLYPHQHGVEWLTSKDWPALVTLPEMLQARGYRTGAFSGNTFWFTREHGFGQGFLHFEDFFHSFADMALRTAYGRLVARNLWRFGYEDIPSRKRAPGTNAAVLRWLARAPRAPFFVTINYMDVHDPYLPPQPYRNKFAGQPNPGGLLNWKLHVPKTLTPAQLQSEIDAYDGSIAYVDHQIDALVAAIRNLSTDRALMVVITSDHGEEFGEHGRFLHGGHLYRETIRVPLIVWQPGRVPAGMRISPPVSNASIPATILGLLGGTPPEGLAPALDRLWTGLEAQRDWPSPLSELTARPWEKDLPVQSGSMRSLVAPTMHFIDHQTRGPQLYDWVNDPRETTDLARRPEMKPVIDQFRARLVK